MLPEQAPWPETLPTTRRGVLDLAAGRFRGLEPGPFQFAWFKLRTDPMFERLVELLGSGRHLLDLGAGYGVPAVWLLAQQPELRVTAVESDPLRARVAEWALGPRGTVHQVALPDLPARAEPADRALIIDVLHYLSDGEVRALLGAVKPRLAPDGVLLVRDTVPSEKMLPWERWVEGWRLRRRGIPVRFRSQTELAASLEQAGFSVVTESTPGREETWFVARLRPKALGADGAGPSKP